MSRRELILRELGLMPLWVPRGQEPQAAQSEAAATAAAVEQGVAAAAGEDRAARVGRLDWPALKEAVSGCTACALHAKRKQAVFGVGDESADWMFVGEGPGADEDARGEPFVGQAGRLLDNMLASVGLARGRNVYIANVVKCLGYDALIQLGDGRWERIGRLVARRYAGTVMSVNASGHLVPRRVVGWYASPLAGRRVFRLSYAAARNESGVELTGDHPVLTTRGWVAVEDLRKGDRIATGRGRSEPAIDIGGPVPDRGHACAVGAVLALEHATALADPERLESGPMHVQYDNVQTLELTPTRSDRAFYCLDVEETYNFVTSGGVVHNCRPPGNRVPEPQEAAQCEPFLLRQIELIQPKLIVALGKTAAANLLRTEASLGSLRGRLHEFHGTPVLVTYHPAYLLRNLPDKAKSWEDLCLAVDTMRALKDRNSTLR